ncbi:MAG: hypothetical protein HYV09_36195 [Deltaproteobacteria bacterium]|nr:hypothetical protein [Deltaproteobacteria bacterium]
MFELRSSHSFNAVPGGELSVIAYEKDVSSTLEERPAVRYEVKGAPSAAGDAGAD